MLFDMDIQEHQNTTDDYYTPKLIFDALGLEFDLDPAHPPYKTSVPCKKYYTIKDNGLEQEWEGLVWMNPPFSKATPWANKFLEHRNGICLMVASKSIWFDKLWNSADAILKTPRNLKFDRMDEPSKRISYQTFMFAFGEVSTQALQNSGLGRIR